MRQLPKGVYESGKGYKAIAWEEITGKHHYLGTYDSAEEAEYRRLLHTQGHHWRGMPVDADTAFGFIYLITNRKTGKMYVGSKQFYFWDGPVGGHKCTDPTNEEWWDEKAWKESDWKTYAGSSKKLQADLDAGKPWDFSYDILSIAQDKLELHLLEVDEQVHRNVLEEIVDGEYLYYNENIARMLFRPPFKKPEIATAQEESMEMMRKYYLKPTICKSCDKVIPFGVTTCECSGARSEFVSKDSC